MRALERGPARAQRTVFVPLSLDIELKKKAAELQVDKSDLYELGARILLAILEAKHIPEELESIIEKRDPEALKLIKKWIRG